jgi:pSer/pThr/pTyr-binding forkhead associated (FHA) protein
MENQRTAMLFCPPLPPLRLTTESPVAIGRHSSCQLAIRREDVSRRHAEVRYEDESFVVRDLGSTNGTYVNDRRLEEPHVLRPGDRIDLGSNVVTFCEIESEMGAGSAAEDEGEAKTMIAMPPLTSKGTGEAFMGDLAEIPPFCLFQVLEMGNMSGLLEIQSEDVTGRLWFQNGSPTHAETEKQAGFDAALTLAVAGTGQFRFQPQVETDEITIRASVTELLLEACRNQDEDAR